MCLHYLKTYFMDQSIQNYFFKFENRGTPHAMDHYCCGPACNKYFRTVHRSNERTSGWIGCRPKEEETRLKITAYTKDSSGQTYFKTTTSFASLMLSGSVWKSACLSDDEVIRYSGIKQVLLYIYQCTNGWLHNSKRSLSGQTKANISYSKRCQGPWCLDVHSWNILQSTQTFKVSRFICTHCYRWFSCLVGPFQKLLANFTPRTWYPFLVEIHSERFGSALVWTVCIVCIFMIERILLWMHSSD